MRRTIFTSSHMKLPFVAGLLVAIVSIASVVGLTGHAMAASPGAACDADAIIHCGFSSAENFISKVKKGNSGNGHSDLQAIYAHPFVAGQRLTKSKYDDFAAHAVKGTAYRDGRIEVNGQVVARNVKNVGRLASMAGAGYSTYTINGQTYYANTNDRIYASQYTTFPVYVLFDKTGTMQFAVLSTCGNPLFGTAVNTSASCDQLTKTAVAGTANTYKFSADIHLQGNAKAKKFVFDFGDGTTQTITSHFGQSVTHTYTSPGTFTARVTEYVSVPGDNNVQLTAVSDCTKQITVIQPNYACVSLTGALLDKQSNTYNLTVTASYANGATPKSVAVDFGDGKQQTLSLSGRTVSVQHDYPDMNHNYTATAAVHFMVSGTAYTATSAGCHWTAPITIPACQALTGAIIDASKYRVQFTATAVTEGATLVGADFTFGDGQVQNDVKPTTATSVATTHDYGTMGNYNATATLHFSANGKNWTAPTCKALVKPTVVVSACKPGVPVGSPLCAPCQYDSSLPADSPDCIAPPSSLPNTGAGNVIAIFAVVLVGGFLAYRHILFRRHKAAFVAAQTGTLPLPLGNPLSDQPLAGTPLEPSRSSFRRRRQF